MPQLGDGRGTAEEAELGLPGDKNGFGLRSRRTKEHEYDGNRSHRRRRHGVHGNAQLAMIGVGGVGVHVRNLGYGENRQQDEAQDGDDRQKADAAAIPQPL